MDDADYQRIREIYTPQIYTSRDSGTGERISNRRSETASVCLVLKRLIDMLLVQVLLRRAEIL